MTGRIGQVCLMTAAVCCTCVSLARACDTPVYRYAMYRWLPAPYEVYYFHDAGLDEAAQQIKAALDKAGQTPEGPANVVFLSVDLAKDKELAGVVSDIKEAWQKQDQPQIPSYLVSSPIGRHLFSGSLTLAEIDAMIDSPARQQVAQLLGEGKAGVYLLLTGEDTRANAAAEQVIRGVVDEVKAGKVSLYTAPVSHPDATEAAEEANAAKLEVGFVTLARGDAKEKWLVEMLLELERDLRDTTEPIVCLVYGRGRALFSCLGKGIHRDNLLQDIEFITGACSCTVKDQNPGVDLLMRFNWDGAAEAIAARFGAEEGSRYEFGGDALFPELIIPAEGELPGSGGESAAAPGEMVAQAEPAASSPPPDATQTGGAATETVESDESEGPAFKPGRSALSSGEVPKPKVQTITLVPHEDGSAGEPLAADSEPTDEAATFGGVLWVGAGLLGALIVLFAATFVVLRPR